MKKVLSLLLAFPILLLTACHRPKSSPSASSPDTLPPSSSIIDQSSSSGELETGKLKVDKAILELIGKQYSDAQDLFGEEGEFINFEGGENNGLFFETDGHTVLFNDTGIVEVIMGNLSDGLIKTSDPITYDDLCVLFEQTPELFEHGGVVGFSVNATEFTYKAYSLYVGFTPDPDTGEEVSDFYILSKT